MDEYIKHLSAITQSTQQLLNDEYHSIGSLEVKQTAVDLGQAVQPCIQHLVKSAQQLKPLIQKCQDELNASEDIWKCKAKIAEASTSEIWDQIGEVTASYARVKSESNTQKKAVLEILDKNLKEQVENLVKKHFTDKNNQTKKGVGWSDKDSFLRDIVLKLSNHSRFYDRTISKHFNSISATKKIIRFKPIFSYIDHFDQNQKTLLIAKHTSDINNLKSCFASDEKLVGFWRLETIIDEKLNTWKKRFGDIELEELVEFSNKLYAEQQKGSMSLLRTN